MDWLGHYIYTKTFWNNSTKLIKQHEGEKYEYCKGTKEHRNPTRKAKV